MIMVSEIANSAVQTIKSFLALAFSSGTASMINRITRIARATIKPLHPRFLGQFARLCQQQSYKRQKNFNKNKQWAPSLAYLGVFGYRFKSVIEYTMASAPVMKQAACTL